MKLLNAKQVRELTGLSRSTIWRKEKSGTFPKRRQISEKRVGWLLSELADFVQSLPKVEA